MRISLDKIGREIFRPMWRHAVQRLEPRLAGALGRLDQLEERLGQLPAAFEDKPGRFDAHLPAFLNALRSVRAFGFELAKVRSRVDHLEAVTADAAALDGRLRMIEADFKAVSGDLGLGERLSRIEAALSSKADATAIDARVQPVEAALHERLCRLEETLASKADAATIPQLWDRLEFVRREIMYEMRYAAGSRAAPASGHAADATEGLSPRPSVEGDDIRLNLGCGHIPVEGYINVDMRRLPGVDLVAAADALPVEHGSVSELFSSHLVEHFPQEMLRRRLLPYWFSLLKPGGRFRAVMPDGDEMIRSAGAGTYGFEEFREVLFGAQDYEGDFHYNLLTPESASELLAEAGFTDIDIPARGRRNGKCFEFEIVAAKPSTHLDAVDTIDSGAMAFAG